QLALAENDVAAAIRAYSRIVMTDTQLGDFDAMDAHLDQMLRLADSVGHPRLTWRALLLGSMRAIARGRFDESERLLAEVTRLSQLTDDPALMMSLGAHFQARSIDLHQNELADFSLAAMDAATASLPGGAVLRPLVRALTWSRMGDLAAAARVFAGFPVESIATGISGTFLGMTAQVCAAAATHD